MSRIVVFGATGYTGALVVRALVASGARPLLAGRSPAKLDRLAEELGGLDTAVADSRDPAGLSAALTAGDVLVSTVGPFLAHGDAAVRAAIDTGASYLDSSGEPPFIARVFEREGPRADGRCALLTAFGYDYVPGNLAGALALAEAGDRVARLDVGYFVTGRAGPGVGMSTGTLASSAGILAEPGFAWRDGRVVPQRTGRAVRSFQVGGRRREGLSIGGSEHYTLPHLAPGLRELNVYLGWFGPLSRALSVASGVNAALVRLPGAGALVRALTAPLAQRTGGGPDATARLRTGSLAVAVAADAQGETLAEVRLRGPNGYGFTADILAWGARRAAEGALTATGALGPVDAFGLAGLQAGCAEAGLIRT